MISTVSDFVKASEKLILPRLKISSYSLREHPDKYIMTFKNLILKKILARKIICTLYTHYFFKLSNDSAYNNFFLCLENYFLLI